MKATRRNILIITSEFPPLPGGIGNHAYNLALQLQHSGYEVTLMADQRDPNPEVEVAFDDKLPFKVHRIAIKNKRIFMYVKRLQLARQLLKHQDVVIVSGKFSLWLGGLVKSLYQIPWLAVIHGSEVNFAQPLLKNSINRALKRMDHIIAVSQYTKSLVAHLPLRAVTVIPNGFNPTDWKQAMGGNEPLKGNPSLLTVGNVTERKGQLQVIKQLPAVLAQYPEAHYHCVGFPTEKNSVINAAKQLGVVDKLTFHGHVSHEALERFYKGTDCFVMLSTETQSGDVEGFGIAILEANYFGLPAIGTRGFGITDAIVDGETGRLIDTQNDQALVKALQGILEQRKFYQKSARLWAEQHDWKKVVKDYIKVIEA
ncbi:glycosyltransferase family 4 protein [Hanstruepera marina]|uniref:glycosyltransferase family 4 protein n=1 Tax=Hanstruepera marina TaxID=2873265 RepID=UPI001CA71587|nr:glycosyltransferase family 4 protein [Hanstruepera marina]